MIRIKHLYIKNVSTLLFIALMIVLVVQCKSSNKETQKKETQSEANQAVKSNNKKDPPQLVHDDKGNIIERHSKAYRKADGSVRSIDDYYYKHDERGNVIEEIKKSHNADGTLNFKNINYYTYDTKNQKIELKFYSYNGNEELQRKARNTYQYNDNGLCTLDLSYNNDDKLFLKIIRQENDKGELSSEEFIHYDENRAKKDHKKYHYNQFGLEKTEDMMKK